jgi:hypothetical protein
MKALILLSLVVASAMGLHGQGTVLFANYSQQGQGVNAPVYESDGVTALSGSQFMAELLAGRSMNNLVSIATTGFLTGGVGIFHAGPETINSVPPGGTAWVQVDVWNTASGQTFAQAKASGLPNSWWQSSVFSVITAGGFQGPPPTPLTGLGNSPVYLNGVPEPSSLAVFSCGLALVLLRNGLTRQSTE